MATQTPPRRLSETLLWLWPYWRPMWKRLVFLLLATPVAVALNVMIPLLVKQIFDQLQRQGVSTELLLEKSGQILLLGFLHFVCYLVVQSLRGLTNYEFEHAFRARLSTVMLKLGQAFFYRFRTGDVTTRLIDDISEKKLGWFACSGIFRLYEALLTLSGCLVCMWQLHTGLTLLTALPLGLLALIYVRSSRLTLGYSQQSQRAISALNSYLTSTLDGIRVLKAYGQEQRAKQAFGEVVEQQLQRELALARVSSLLEISYTRFSELGVLVIFLLGGWLVIQGQITLGTLMAFNSYIFMLIWPMVDIGQFFIKGRQASISVERVRELEEFPPDPSLSSGFEPLPRGDLELELRELCFSFGEQPVLQQVSLTARSGQTLALAGAIGSGKSLVLSCVPRMLEPDLGQLWLNQRPLKEYDLGALRQAIGFVSQTPSLFSATIRENILFGREGISDDALAQAVRVAQLEQDLPLFAEGLDTVIGQRGVKISGGQKQRIAIARALVHRPRILILDDCTSALDAETEARFWQALHDFVPGMLVLLVTHRVRTLQQADQIVLLQQGQVVVTGTHIDLADHPLYRQLYLAAPALLES